MARATQSTGWLKPTSLATLLVATGMTQAIYPFVLTSAMLLRRVSWRGPDFEVAGPWQIHLTRYVPYGETSELTDDRRSL